MKVQFQILIFMVCLNLSTGLAIELNVPGTEYVQATNPSNVSEYEEHFNATEIAEGWGATPFQGIPVIGDIFSMFQTVYRVFSYLILGFPMFLNWLGDSFILDATARTSYDTMVGVLYAIFGISMCILFIEFIAGRYFSE